MRIAILTANLNSFDKVQIPIAQRGDFEYVYHSFNDLNFPPIKGPITKPMPNAAPMSPKTLVLFSLLVTSAKAAWATAIFPPVMPSKSPTTH